MVWIVIGVALYSFSVGFCFSGVLSEAARDPRAKDSQIPFFFVCSMVWPLLLFVRTK